MLSVRGLTKGYAGRDVLSDVAFDLHPGTVTAVLGYVGAGKSTLLRAVCGLVTPSAGGAILAGRAFPDWPCPAHVAGVVLDPDAVHPGRTGREQLRIAARLAGLGAQRVDEVLYLLGLEPYAEHNIGSYGRVLRLWWNLAHALLPDPPVLLLDDPLWELAAADRATVRALLRTRADRGGTVLFTSQQLSEVDHSVDRALVLREGRLVADGPVSMLTAVEMCEILGSDNRVLADALSRAGVRIRPCADGYLSVRLSAERVTEFAHAAGVRVIALRQGERTLDEVLTNLIGET